MPQLVTITSKRQLTIPVNLFNQLNLKTGHQLVAYREERSIRLEPAADLVDRLAGSVKLPAKFKKQPLEAIISHAKRAHFKKK